MKKCPHCEFELIADQKFCPNCGAKLIDDIAIKPENDNIKWSEYQDVPIESVIEHFSELHDGNDDEEAETDEFADNPILAEYIRKHKDGYKEAAAEELQEPVGESAEVVEEPEPVEEQPTEEPEIPVIPVTEDSDEVAETPAEEPEEAKEISEEKIAAVPFIDPIPEPIKASEPEVKPEQNIEPQPEKQPTTPKKSKKKYWLTAAALVVVAGGAWMYYDNQQKEKAEAARQEQLRVDTAVARIETELENFYLDQEEQFVVPGKTAADVEKLMQELEEYSSEPKYEELKDKGQKLQVKIAVLDQINSHFAEPIVVGDELKENVHVKDGDSVDMALLTEDTPFAKLINQAIKQGKEEFKELQATNAAVESLTSNYKEEQLSDSVTRKDYEDTKEKVDKLFEGEEKKAYLAQLATIEKALDKREAEAQELAEQQAQAAAEAAQNEASSNQTEQTEQPQAEPEAPVQEQTPTTPQTNAGSEILGPNTPKNSNNEPIISSRQSDIDDANNPAWNWAPGVYDKVINESIKRGYIVEGDFYVERVRIENGEGYYNLYATSNKSSLLKGTSESALPMYLFTINAKTGFFRGNGSN
jgi:hypothetical protein